jgi:adenylate cyclase
MTDYIAFANRFAIDKGQGMLGSWSTTQAGGFTDGDIDSLLAIQYSLAVACRMAMLGGVAKSALSTYLGAHAGARVLAGQIRRGDGETTRAAIVWGDLRNSTRMADQLGCQAYIDSLNDFFDAAAGPFAASGGDILGFIGDGFLAVFPCRPDQKDSGVACRHALDAALEATQRMAETNHVRQQKNEAALGYGLSLHIGNVMLGNVGLPERLSFSVFGSAVNETARLEALTKRYATPIIASRAFADCCGGAWESLGSANLRGVDAPVDVLRPAQLRLLMSRIAMQRRIRAAGTAKPASTPADEPPAAGNAARHRAAPDAASRSVKAR